MGNWDGWENVDVAHLAVGRVTPLSEVFYRNATGHPMPIKAGPVHVTFTYPIPPTDNHRQRNHRDTKTTREWKQNAFYAIKEQMGRITSPYWKFPVEGLVRANMRFHLPLSWKGDVANLQKLTLDVLSAPADVKKAGDKRAFQIGAGVIVDDVNVWAGSFERVTIPLGEAPYVEVKIERLEDRGLPEEL